MNRVRVKICGLTDAESVRVAVGAGADAVGFVFSPSPRRLDPERGAELAGLVPPGVTTVAVFRHPEPELARAVIEGVRPAWVQSDAEDAPLFAGAAARFLPVYRGAEALDRAAPGEPLLFEGRRSGAGERADWGAAAELARRCPLVLAGGLDAGNVGAAIDQVAPFAVDVSSGVESAPGKKDAQKIAAFIDAVRRAQEIHR